MKEYKNLVFDIGGVLMSYRFEGVLVDIGYSLEEAIRIDQEIFNSGYWDDLDSGFISLDEAKELCCKKYPEDADAIRYLLEHPEDMPIPRYKVWDLVHALKEKGYDLYIISNYSEVLLNAHTKEQAKLGKASFWDDMNGAVISYLEGCLKPYPEIYNKLLERYGLKATECIFFDDRLENVEGAKAVGMDAIQIKSEEHMIEVLENILK